MNRKPNRKPKPNQKPSEIPVQPGDPGLPNGKPSPKPNPTPPVAKPDVPGASGHGSTVPPAPPISKPSKPAPPKHNPETKPKPQQLPYKPKQLQPLDWWPSTKDVAKTKPPKDQKTPTQQKTTRTFVTPSGILVTVECSSGTDKDGPTIRSEQKEYIGSERKIMEDAARHLGVSLKDIPGLLLMCQKVISTASVLVQQALPLACVPPLIKSSELRSAVDQHDCCCSVSLFQHNIKFCDPEFPAVSESINVGGCENLLWMRPNHFLERPSDAGLHVKSIEPNDIDQGHIGWVLPAPWSHQPSGIRPIIIVWGTHSLMKDNSHPE